MTDQSSEEQKKATIAAMGEELGTLYSALWQELAIGYTYWLEYVDLFGTKSSRIDMLNQAAPMFFRMIQDELWDMTLLKLARMTDPALSMGRRDRPNLSIQALALPDLITDAGLKSAVAKLVDNALKATDFARDRRNRLIAHRDLRIALNTATTPLKDASRAQVKDALASLAAVLNALASHFLRSETRFDMTPRRNGAVTLLYLLDDGLRSREESQRRLESGQATKADFAAREI
ncbi:MAG TPA: hypothetical protein VG735_10490 [Caulobacterales bacterium]|nr:hypothetical protein [Caulobacterales bacterium]